MIIENSDGNPKQSATYSCLTGSVNTAGTAAATDITAIAAFATLFTPFTSSSTVKARIPSKIRITVSGTAYVKINGGHVMTLSATVPFSADDLLISSIGVSDNTGNVSMTVYLQ